MREVRAMVGFVRTELCKWKQNTMLFACDTVDCRKLKRFAKVCK